jgi:hypothetical protein
MRRAIYAFIAIAIVAFAGGFPAYMAFGQGGGSDHAAVTVTATPSFVTPPPPGGGGGGGGGEEEVDLCPPGELYAGDNTTIEGFIFKTIVVRSFDERFELTIDTGITAMTSYGVCLSCIGILKMPDSPPLLEDASLIGVLYDSVPDRATFFPPATLEYSYDPTAVPEGVTEDMLFIAYYDRINDVWVPLDSVVDTQAKIVTATISRFNDLAVFGYQVEAPPPAAFEISSFGISPRRVLTGEPVTITLLVANTGGQPASYQVTLNINGATEASKEVILGPGAEERVSFTTLKGSAGTYSVDVNGATGAFEVELMPLPPEPFNWWLIVAIIAALTLAALLSYVFIAQKKGGVSGTLMVELGKITSLAPKIASAFSSLFSKIKKG